MQLRLQELRERGCEVLAISGDPPEESRKMAEEMGLDFPLLSDSDFAVIKAWGVMHPDAVPGQDAARPATFLIDENGQVRWRELTDNWRVRLRPERVFEQLDALP